MQHVYHNDKCHDGFVSCGIPVDVHVCIQQHPPKQGNTTNCDPSSTTRALEALMIYISISACIYVYTVYTYIIIYIYDINKYDIYDIYIFIDLFMTHDLYIPSATSGYNAVLSSCDRAVWGSQVAPPLRPSLSVAFRTAPRRKPGRPCGELSGVAEKPTICWHKSGICCRENEKIMRKQ
jgi:hypothetical protein